jgi:signal-transduction protein with cAMP-binding, CBS, and nucleotidyltransferase domain
MSGEGVLVRDAMKKNVVTIESNESIKEAAIKMSDAGIGAIIITKNKSAIGILTERDFVRRVYAKELPLSSPVSEVMSKPLITIDPSESIWDLSELMKIKNIHKVAVVENDNLVGIVTNTDVVSLASLGSDSEMRRICDQIYSHMKN